MMPISFQPILLQFLTAAVTCWSPQALSDGGRSLQKYEVASSEFFYTAVSLLAALKEGRVVNPPEAADDR